MGRLRGRAWLGAALVVGAGLYFGRNLALAHGRPEIALETQELPALAVCAQDACLGWLPDPAGAVRVGTAHCLIQSKPAVVPGDPWSDPEIHQFEESCNQNGVYPSTTEYGQEFTLDRAEQWKYSSLEGLQRSPAGPLSAPEPAQLRGWGWDESAPLWALATPQGLSGQLPAGVAWSDNVRALEARLWPEKRQGMVTVYLAQAPELPDSQEMSQVWQQLPPATAMGCLRREVADALWARTASESPQVVRKMLASSEHWLGIALEAELAQGDLGRVWERMNRGWTPAALWTDQELGQVSSSQYVAVSSRDQGSLLCFGMEPASGMATSPWDSFLSKDQKLTHAVGSGRFHWRYAGDLQRVEWLALQEGRKLQVKFRWSATPNLPEAAETETMTPELEAIYTPHPNVIAGQ